MELTKDESERTTENIFGQFPPHAFEKEREKMYT